MEKLKDKLGKNFNFIWVFFAIATIGIFFRTYNFHDWLRFNADQGRDAQVVSEYISGKSSLPLLGPKAGGTNFKLGPAFYYFEIIAAKIFGDYPDKMAYPDLFTSILTIGLLFLFLRKYFSDKISLSLSAIYAVSAYAIRYSRFAWNPNSTPFWTLLSLYALYEIFREEKNRKLLWAVVAGFAIGVAVQLHTTLLLFLPISTIVLFGYLGFKNRNIWKYFFIIFAFSVFLNTPQIIHEYKYKGENIKAFFGGIKTKDASESNLAENFIHGNSSLFQIVPDILSGYEISDTFKLKFDDNHQSDVIIFVISAIFTLFGVMLTVKDYKKEKDKNRKVFLLVIGVYSMVAYLLFIKLAFELSVRFYLVLFFVPFILLGFYFKFFEEKFGRKSLYVLSAITLLLIVSNLYFDKKYFDEFRSYAKNGGTVNIITLKQAEEFANFISLHSVGKKEIAVSGNKKFLFKAFMPIKYLVEKNGSKLALLGKNEGEPATFFYIARGDRKKALLSDAKYTVIDYKTYGKFTILQLEKK